MTLRIQLLCVGLLTLILPWSGYRYVQELESALRGGLEQTLLASAQTVAGALDERALTETRAGSPRSVENTLYAMPLSTPPVLDGFASDWNLPAAAQRPIGDDGRFWVGVQGRALYLHIEVDDQSLVYQPGPTERPYGDRVVLRSSEWLLLQTTAPGPVRAQMTSAPAFAPTGRLEGRVSAFWRETAAGYVVEARLPLDVVGDALGIAVVDVDPPSAPTTPVTLGDYTVRMDRSWPAERDEPLPLLYRPQALADEAAQFERPGRRLRIVDRDGWVLFDGGAIDPLEQVLERPEAGIAELVLGAILRRGDPAYADIENPPGFLDAPALREAMPTGGVAWYTRGTTTSAIVAAVAPISRADGLAGAVVLEQSSDAILTLTNDALVDLLSFTLLASVLVALGLLSYATYLSVRIRRLARAADTALGPKGEIDPTLPGRNAGDEIGDLARSYAALLQRLKEHTLYLTTLKGKLAHELRTPLAVVTTSLENLEREPHGENLVPYLERLRDGSSRLDGILAAMSEATALEQAIGDAPRERFVLADVVRGSVAGFRDVYADRRFELTTSDGRAEIVGSAELVAQMLDKLVDNAVSFSPLGATIAVGLHETGETLAVTIANPGPRLPEAMRSSIFDSLVSLRGEGQSRGHLGLGLYVVALIAEFHGAQVSAEDLPDASGVRFSVDFPRAH
jgi:two-component system sensor histidine kinase ChvG